MKAKKGLKGILGIVMLAGVVAAVVATVILFLDKKKRMRKNWSNIWTAPFSNTDPPENFPGDFFCIHIKTLGFIARVRKHRR